MLRVVPTWLAGYAGLILAVAVLVNLVTQLSRVAYGLVLPSMEDGLGLSHFQAGGLITVTSLMGIASAFVFGMLAPRYGSRVIVGMAALATALAMALLGASFSYLFALAMCAVMGFTIQGCTTPVMGLLSVWFDSRNRGTAAGIAAAGGGASFVVIGTLVPWFTGRDPVDGWRHTWYALAVIVAVAGVVSLLFLRDRPGDAGGRRAGRPAWPVEAYREPLVWLIALLAFCSGWTTGVYTTFFGLYLEEREVALSMSGLLFTLLGPLGIVSGIFWGTASDRLGRRAGFFLSFATLGAGTLLFWVTPLIPGFVASAVLVGLSFRAAYIICAASAGDYVPPHFSAAAFGLMGMGAGLGNALGPLLAGHIADATQVRWVFVLATGAATFAVVSSTFLKDPRGLRPPAPENPPGLTTPGA